MDNREQEDIEFKKEQLLNKIERALSLVSYVQDAIVKFKEAYAKSVKDPVAKQRYANLISYNEWFLKMQENILTECIQGYRSMYED